MPGANYMGGKRNAAKARTKDVVGRQQKGFFGRQRLDILSKGLQASRPKLSKDASDPRAREGITLAHAHSKNIPETSLISSPIPETPPPRKKRRILMEAHTSSPRASGSSGRQSKVLDALDIEEPLFLRSVLDRILAMPDLAGLPSVKEAERSMPMEVVLIATRGSKRQRSLSPSDFQDSYVFSENWPSSSRISMAEEALTHEQTDMGERAHIFTDSVHSTSSRREYQSSSHASVQQGFEDGQHEEESAFNDSGYAEFESGTNDRESVWPTSSSFHTPNSLPRASSREGPALHVPSPPRFRQAATAALVQDSSSNSEALTSDDAGLSFSWLPSVISLKPRRAGSWPAYGCLFEQEDPWRTIGLILGLPESTPAVERVGLATKPHGEDRYIDQEILDGVMEDFQVEEFEDGEDDLQDDAFDGVLRLAEEIHVEAIEEGESDLDDGASICSEWTPSPVAALDNRQDQVYEGETEMHEVECESRQEYSLFSSPPVNASSPTSLEISLEKVVSPGIASEPPLGAGQVGFQDRSIITVAELHEFDGRFFGPSLFGKEVVDSSEDDE